MFWSPLVHSTVGGGDTKAALCFRHISFNLVDIVHLLHPLSQLSPEQAETRRGVMQRFRETTFQAYNITTPAACGETLEPGSVVSIVSRKPGGPRHITNEPELLEAVASLGFKGQALVLEELGMVQQLEAFSKTCVFVAAHGAGVMNALFLPPQARVIQIFSFGLRYDYAKSTLDCGAVCYRGEYVHDMVNLLYGAGRYGEIDIPRSDTVLHTNDVPDKTPFELWETSVGFCVNSLIKGKSEFSVNAEQFRKVLVSVAENSGIIIEIEEIPRLAISRANAISKRGM